MNGRRKAFALLRVSTDQQDTARQKTAVRRVAESHGLTIERTVELQDVSGRMVLAHRDIQHLLADLKRPDIAGVAVSALDRLFRPDNYSDFAILDSFRQTRKLIFSDKEGALDPASDSGFLMSLMSGAVAGQEWRTLRQRSQDGKWEKRKLGRNVNGSVTLPRGIAYRRITDAAGRTVGGEWSYDDRAVRRIREAYRILFADHTISLTALAKCVGWTWAHSLRRTLQNPIWKGSRVYPPSARQPEPLEVKLPLEPLLTPDEWALAQSLLAKRRTWSKETRDQRFLGAGLLVCQCGKKYYFHGDARRGQHDVYYCASRHPRGKGCGSASLWREVVDEAIMRIIQQYMTDPKFLAAVFRRVEQTPRPDTREQREKELAKLAARRKKWIEQFDQDRIAKQEFEQRIDAVEKATREIEASMLAVPPPIPDTRAIVGGLVRTLARFRTWPFTEQRGMLKRVVRGFQVVDAAIAQVTVSGAFLGELGHTNSAQRSIWPYWRRCPEPAPPRRCKRIRGCAGACAARSGHPAKPNP
jgi:DNA invertase Pin-like site-specific DNA recombinase